jgi:hypothetical protein
MDMTITGLPPIPVEYIVGVAQTKDTDAKRRPYVSLIEDWGKERDMEQEASDVLKQLRDNQEIDVKKMPKEFSPKYREKEVAKQLIAIINDINDIISTKSELWTWAHVMRVMIDEGILIKLKVNRFDAIICSMIPGKGRDNVRKSGDYNYLLSQEMPWSMWTSLTDSNLGSEKTICNMIAQKFSPILERTIRMEY